MPVKIYFGPHKDSPAPELPTGERQLWIQDFHLARGVERDFWTNNVLLLDVFEPEQIYVWHAGRWLSLPIAADLLMPGWDEDADLKDTTCGKLALACHLVSALQTQTVRSDA